MLHGMIMLDHEQILPLFILFSSYYSGTSWSLSHMCIGWCSSIYSGKGFSWLLTLTQILLPCVECSWSGQMLLTFFLHQEKNNSFIHLSCFLWSFGLFVFLSSLAHSFFLRMYQVINLAKPNVFALSLWASYWELTTTDSKYKCHTWHQLYTLSETIRN